MKTEKKIEDYLHLYIGCEVKVPYGDIGKLNFVSAIDGFCDVVFGTTGLDFNKVFFLNEVKPILRPLSDMTDKEAVEIAEIVATPQFIEVKLILNRCMDTNEDKCKIQRIDYQAYQQIKHSRDKRIDFILQISSWGTINCYSNGELGNNTKQVHVTNYLLKQGFDLFGLIETGIAIDKTLNI